MSLRRFLKTTRLLLAQGLYESRRAIASESGTDIRTLQLHQLEERILMSASPLAAAASAPDAAAATDAAALTNGQLLDVVADSLLPQPDTAEGREAAVPDAESQTAPSVDSGSVEQTAADHTLELVFLDSAVSDLEQMLAVLQAANALDDNRTLEVVVLDAQQNGIAQITSTLLQFSDVDAIHIVSLGSDGQLQLGSTLLSQDNLETYRSAITAWQYSLSEDADLLFYGCDLAATAEGQELMNLFAAACGCDVAASEDLTGHTDLGGDWDLEYTTGQIETQVALSAELQADWQHVLAATVDAASSGATADQASVTVSHTTSGTNRLMLVGVSMQPEGENVTSVTYNGVNLSLVGVEENPVGKSRVEIWQLLAPSTGTHDVVVNLSGTSHKGVVVGVQTFNNINQTTPTYGFSSSSGDSANASATVAASAADDLVFGVVASHKGGSVSPGTGQTENWDVAINNANGGGTVQSGGGTVSPNWTVTSDKWSAAAITVQADTNSEQSVTLSAVKDAYIQLKNPSTSDGASGTMVIDREDTDLQRALVQFDLSGLPAGITISDAQLNLNATSVDGLLTIDAYQVQQSWTEASVTWNQRSSGTSWSTAGGTFNSTALDSISTDATGTHTFSITSLVQDWVDGVSQNYGVLIGSPDGGGNRTIDYTTRESATAPELVIYYEVTNNPPTDITPNSANVHEHTDTSSGYSVATLNTADPDAGDTFTYSIIGGTDAAKFSIGGAGLNQLLLTDGILNFEAKPSYSVTVRTTDSNGATYDETLTVNVNNLNDAPVLDNTGTMQLTDVLQNSVDPAGDLVAAIITSAGGDRITDADAGAVEGIAVVGTDTINGTWEYSINGGSSWTAFGSVSTATAVVLTDTSNDRIRFVPNTGYSGNATITFRAWDRSDGQLSGTSNIDTTSNGVATAFSTATETAGVTVQPVEVLLWMSTTQDVGPAYSRPTSGVTGLPSWSESSVIGIGDPGLSFGAGSTSGTFGLVSDFNAFAGDGQTKVSGLHFVTSDTTLTGGGISGGSVSLLAEDLLFVAGSSDTLSNAAAGAPAGWSNTIAVTAGSVYAFRAENPGDYSSGYFRLVMAGPGGSETQAITLVEQAVTLGGDVVVDAGDFLFSELDDAAKNSVYWYDTSADMAFVLIDGEQIGIDSGVSGEGIVGLELVESGATVGGIPLSTGSILATIDKAGTVGNNSLVVNSQDVFALNITATTYGSGTAAATADLLFDGDGSVGFDDAPENLDALSLIITGTGANQAPVIGNSGAPVNFVESGAPVPVDGSIVVADADSGNFDGAF